MNNANESFTQTNVDDKKLIKNLAIKFYYKYDLLSAFQLVLLELFT